MQTARVEANGALIEVQRSAESLAGEAEEQADQGRIDPELGRKSFPGPGWTSKKISEGGRQNRLYWVPPSRGFGFRKWQQACDFEHLRIKCDNDEVKALAELKKTTETKVRFTWLSKPGQKTTQVAKAIGQRTIKKIGAKAMKRKESTSIEALTLGKIEGSERGKTNHEAAKKFPNVTIKSNSENCLELDQAVSKTNTLQTGKIVAKRTGRQMVTSVELILSRSFVLSPPGPGWNPKLVKYKGQNRYHWFSPCRDIEFKRRINACHFEELRKKNGNDEVQAWREYRRTESPTFVVSPHQYDLHDTRPSPTFLPKREQVTKPNSERSIQKTANAKGKRKSALTGAGSSKLGQNAKPVIKADGQRVIKKIGAKRAKKSE